MPETPRRFPLKTYYQAATSNARIFFLVLWVIAAALYVGQLVQALSITEPPPKIVEKISSPEFVTKIKAQISDQVNARLTYYVQKFRDSCEENNLRLEGLTAEETTALMVPSSVRGVSKSTTYFTCRTQGTTPTEQRVPYFDNEPFQKTLPFDPQYWFTNFTIQYRPQVVINIDPAPDISQSLLYHVSAPENVIFLNSFSYSSFDAGAASATVVMLLLALAIIIMLSGKSASEDNGEDALFEAYQKQNNFSRVNISMRKNALHREYQKHNRDAFSFLMLGILIAFAGVAVFALLRPSNNEDIRDRLVSAATSDVAFASLAAKATSQSKLEERMEAIKDLPEMLQGNEQIVNSILSFNETAAAQQSENPPGNDAANGSTTDPLPIIDIIRTTGILFFIQAIAWFLLQQFRRSNRKAQEVWARLFELQSIETALCMIDEGKFDKKVKDADKLVFAHLLIDKSEVRLRKNETTERIELSKEEMENPIFRLVESFAGQFKKAKKQVDVT